MQQYADYAFYSEQYGGEMAEKSFNRYANAAAAFITQITQGRKLPKEAAAMAVCAVAEVMQRQNTRAGVAGENNDGLSISYTAQTEDAAASEAFRAAALYLGGQGLFFRGFYPSGGDADAGR